MAEPEINAFLTHLAVKENASASTQNQALSAILFFIGMCLGARFATWVMSYALAGRSDFQS